MFLCVHVYVHVTGCDCDCLIVCVCTYGTGMAQGVECGDAGPNALLLACARARDPARALAVFEAHRARLVHSEVSEYN